MQNSAEIAVDVREIEALNYVFLRVMGQIFLSASSNAVFNEMTGAQRRILYYLDLKGSISMSEVARLVGCTVPAATGVVEKLVKSDQVKREPCSSDRRVIRIGLTEEPGAVPGAISTGIGHEVRRPMSVAVFGGLIVSTILTLLVVPCFYSVMDDALVWMKARLRRREVDPPVSSEPPPPAIGPSPAHEAFGK